MIIALGACFLWQQYTIVTSSSETQHDVRTIDSENAYKYVVCNGFSNQLLSHSGHIAFAVASKRPVLIPDAFIMNGEQRTMSQGRLVDMTPSLAKYAKLSNMFDVKHLVSVVESFGITATVVPYTEEMHSQLKCSWLDKVRHADSGIVRAVLDAFVGSSFLQKVVDNITAPLPDSTSCVHHRDGSDWYAHCAVWQAIRDGHWRQNCLMEQGRTLVDEVWKRVSSVPRATRNAVRPSLYYVGDNAPPPSLKDDFQLFTRSETVSKFENRETWMIQDSANNSLDLLPLLASATCPSNSREVCAAADFLVCGSLSNFVGNSVSTWSALQIAKRDSMASWYNSRSIPLSEFWSIFSIPIVYTYTEMSSATGKYMLMASISSVKRQLPNSHIHILYHGNADDIFLQWLNRHGVTIHEHRPAWTAVVRKMFESGNSERSHLFGNWGNYIGTWQRIDIPLFVQAEYVLYLDCDTVVMSPFTLADFGAEMTQSIAFSTEMSDKDGPCNAGVALLNVPYLRETYTDFLSFITRHQQSGMFRIQRHESVIPVPSDQGAFLEFYNSSVKLLDTRFNTKVYSPLSDDVKVFHFHGAKPHDYLGHLLGKECHRAFRSMCQKYQTSPMKCDGLQRFAVHLHQNKLVDEYCSAVFPASADGEACREYFTAASTTDASAWRQRCDVTKRNIAI